MQQIKSIETEVRKANQLLNDQKTTAACDIFLKVWEDLKRLMQQGAIKDIEELQAAYPWQDFVANWVQDIEQELHNAGLENPVYFNKRIQYCEELLTWVGASDQLMIENTRRAIADSYFALDNMAECDRLYQGWLQDDPTWGWGYIGWSDCYHWGFKDTALDQAKAAQIVSQALAVADLRDRADVVDRAVEIYRANGDEERASELQAELDSLQTIDQEPEPLDWQPLPASPVRVEHVGRNDPCPCGSGKKYKKCCGQ